MTDQLTDVMFSEQVGEIGAAIALAQTHLKNPKKEVVNTYFKTNYADLAAVIDACRLALAEQSIACVQLAVCRGERAGCVTRLIHKSGQWIQSTLLLRPKQDDPQAAGSAITYARRYALMAMLCIAGDDDDGEAATEHKPAEQPDRKRIVKAEKTEPLPTSDEYQVQVGGKLRIDALSPEFKAAWAHPVDVCGWVENNTIMGFTSWREVETCKDVTKLQNLYMAIKAETEQRAGKVLQPAG